MNGVETTEAERVETFRTERFVQLGFDAVTASWLAKSDADLHQVESLLAHGCTHQLAYQISR